MINDRVVLVGIAWTVVLIGLLVVREFLRAMDGRAWQSAIRATNILVVVMLVAVGLAAALRLTALATPPGTAADSPRPSATPSRQPIGPPPSTPASATLGPPPGTPAPPTPLPTPPPPPATPSPTPPATPSPTPPATPSPTPEVTRSPRPAAGEVSAGPAFRVYELQDGTVSGYRSTQAARRFTARSTVPEAYSFPSFGDPDGTIRLVRILDGPFAGSYVSPDDRGIEYRDAS